MNDIRENERIDEVNDRLKLIQKTDGLTFGTDALLLASFIKKRGARALELGGGSGIISMLLAARERFSHIVCAEVQPEYADLCRRNFVFNGLCDRVEAIEADIRNTALLGESESFDAVFSNPPYMTGDCGEGCKTDAKQIARHEVYGTVADFAACAAKMLRWGGEFYTVYRPERLVDLYTALRGAGLEPKRMTFVHAKTGKEPSMVLTEAKKGGKPGLKITRPLLLDNKADVEYYLENGILPADF